MITSFKCNLVAFFMLQGGKGMCSIHYPECGMHSNDVAACS
jgi:hypothetical protein